MKKYRLIIFDADGTLRRCTVEGQPCPNKPGEWELMPGVKERLAEFDWDTVAVGIASNQAGVAYGYLTKHMAFQLLKDMVAEATGRFPPTGLIRACPHAVEDECRCRKPKPGMLWALMGFWFVAPSHTLYVGDMESDRLAAEAAGVDFMWAEDFFKEVQGGSLDCST